jgi:diapolycopene oxygenase
MERQPTLAQLLHQSPDPLKTTDRPANTSSAMVLHLGLNRRYPHLLAHNFFYPNNKSLRDLGLSNNHAINNPTLYVHATSISNPNQAPADCESLSILLHLPPIDSKQPLTADDYQQLRTFIIDQLEGMGLSDLRQHIVAEHYWTPHDFQRNYHANQGSIYGTTPQQHHPQSAQLCSSSYKNLYFVGGTSAFGGGMPMAVLSGQRVRDTILDDLGQRKAA